uniref:Uncharacterized protein n=1 Tax=Tanacetum cinerariifolium TaxID=118510 RepID=A0A6L2MRU2_TANCI|nr:hypothetical protein [Tanacetum cinerariifolium]
MTHKLDDMIEFPNSRPKETYREDLDSEMVMVKIPSTPQVLSSFEEYTPPVTYPEEVEETLGTPIEEVPIFDEPKPQPRPLHNYTSLDVILREERGPDPPTKPHSLDILRMKVVDHLTIHTPPSPHVTFPP